MLTRSGVSSRAKNEIDSLREKFKSCILSHLRTSVAVWSVCVCAVVVFLVLENFSQLHIGKASREKGFRCSLTIWQVLWSMLAPLNEWKFHQRARSLKNKSVKCTHPCVAFVLLCLLKLSQKAAADVHMSTVSPLLAAKGCVFSQGPGHSPPKHGSSVQTAHYDQEATSGAEK